MSVLDRITRQTRADLDARKAARPLRAFRDALQPSDRSLEDALRAPHTGFILECKKASPSRGLLREDFDPVQLARAYRWAADGISVLTDQPFFQGSFEVLSAVREAVSAPVLCKDFLLEPYQVYEARSHGADAVLLMLSVLDDDAWRACHEAAEALSVDALTEVHDADELERALHLGARIIGVNNRDLTTLRVDLATTEALAPRIPDDRVVVSESGVFTHADVRRLRGHADAFLIGSSLVLADDTDRALRAIVTGTFKVCGLTRAEDARAAWEAGASYGGLIFAPESPRAVDLDRARTLTAAAPELDWVGVFVNAPEAQIAEHARALSLSAVQLHGEETPEAVRALRDALPEGCAIWKAHRVRERVPDLEELGAPDRLLLDAFKAGQRGGTGTRFDWSLLPEERSHIILSGGLSPENIAEADALGVAALDVNSGVEDAPGVKSAQRLRALRRALQG